MLADALRSSCTFFGCSPEVPPSDLCDDVNCGQTCGRETLQGTWKSLIAMQVLRQVLHGVKARGGCSTLYSTDHVWMTILFKVIEQVDKTIRTSLAGGASELTAR